MEARRAQIADMEHQYTISQNNTDDFYKFSRQRVEEYRQQSPDLAEKAGGLIVPEGLSASRESSSSYHLFVKGNKRAFEDYSVNTKDKSRTLMQQGAYDGETLKLLEPQRLSGLLKRESPQNILRFPTFPKMLGLEGRELSEYLKSDGVECQVTGTKIVDGDTNVELLIRRRHTPVPEQPIETVIEHRVTINAQKNFWPTKIERYDEIRNVSTGESARSLKKRIEVGEFAESNGVFFPKQIQESNYECEYSYSQGGLIPKLSEPKLTASVRTVTEKLAINTGLSDDAFKLEFPKGTRYYDANLGMAVVVGADPLQMAEEMARNADALPVKLFTEEQAKAILELRRQGKVKEAEALRRQILDAKRPPAATTKPSELASTPTSTPAGAKVPVTTVVQAGGTSWLVYAVVILFCFVLGAALVLVRRWRNEHVNEHR